MTNRSVEVAMKVPFHDTDAMQVVWHGNYLKYFEIARDRLLDENDANLFAYGKPRGLAFPIVKVAVKHILPLMLGDEFHTTAELIDGKRKIVFDYFVRRALDGAVCVKGRTEQVAVAFPAMESLLSIPDDLREKLGF
jgi:acyl-CoA thioester hydrolase